MTKKDYRTIGQALFRVKSEAHDVGARAEEAVDQVVLELCQVFERDNPRFDRDRFLRFVKTGEDTR
jgi:hypothetical protein